MKTAQSIFAFLLGSSSVLAAGVAIIAIAIKAYLLGGFSFDDRWRKYSRRQALMEPREPKFRYFMARLMAVCYVSLHVLLSIAFVSFLYLYFGAK